MARRRNTYEDSSFDPLFTGLSVVAAAIAAVAAYFLGFVVLYIRNEIIRVAVTFFVFTFVLLLLLLGIALVTGRFKENVFTGRSSVLSILPILLAVCIGVMLLAGVFQFVYQLEFVPTVDAYIFMVDISGSMSSNDPSGDRFRAIDGLIAEKGEDFPYMVYAFESDLMPVRGMLTTREQQGYTVPGNWGGTDLYDCLDQLMLDLESGKHKIPENTHVIVITDAETSVPSNATEILDKFKNKNMPISTIYLKVGNSSLLRQISDHTGGNCVQVSNASELGSAVTAATSSSRTLLDSQSLIGRTSTGKMILLCAMRILFLTLLSCAIAFGSMVAYGRHEAGKFVLISAPIKSLVAALICVPWMEMLFGKMRSLSGDVIFGIFLLTLMGIALMAKARDWQYGDDMFKEDKRAYSVSGNKGKKSKSSGGDDYDFLFQ